MSQCPCGIEGVIAPQARVLMNTSSPESLPIEVNRKKPTCLVPGASRIYCYWKIAFHIDIAQKDVEIFVPPEWRWLSTERLASWVGKLRDNPFEDIVLGRVLYHWAIDVLLPSKQDYSTVPIHGRSGWPNLNEPIPYWNTPRVKYETDRLPITINRTPILPSLGMEKLVCYWQMRLPRTVQPRRYVWVPPEWRKLTDKTRRLWARRLGANPEQPIVLGETHYYWDNDTIIPHGQNPYAIEYVGLGRYADTTPKEEATTVEEEEKINEFRASTPGNQGQGTPMDTTLNNFIREYEGPIDATTLGVESPQTSDEQTKHVYMEPFMRLETSV